MSAASVLAGLSGAAAAAGLLMILAGLRPAEITAGPARSVPGWWRRVRNAGRGRGRRLLAGVGVGLLAGVVTGWPVVGLAAAAAVAGVPRLLSGAATARQLARLEALEAWTRRLADILGSGAGGLEQAIGMSVRTCPAAIQPEVSRLAARLPAWRTEAALRAFADDLADLGSPAGDMVAAALILRVRHGGRGLRPVLEALAGDVADLVRARRAVEADRAKPRANARTLIGTTTVVLTATLIFARSYLAPFGTPAGQLMLTLIVAVFAAGLAAMARITAPPTATRILTPSPSTSDTVVGGGSGWD
jgi:tight adherence protein B